MKKEMKYGVITGMNDLWAWIAGNQIVNSAANSCASHAKKKINDSIK